MTTARALPPVDTPAAVKTMPALQDTRRITEQDPDFQRLHRATVRGLMASLQRLVRDLRAGMRDQDAAEAFVRRHTLVLKNAYLAGFEAGATDYYEGVSRTPARWAKRVNANERLLAKRLLFYAAASTLKMANEAVAAWHQAKVATGRQTPPREVVRAFADDALQQWYIGVAARVTLQAGIAWNGLNDGYVEAGDVDPANPYAVLFWDLEPAVKQHCADCPTYAEASPYDRPGTGGNQLDAVPGDGRTACGAGCKCLLRYALALPGDDPRLSWFDGPQAPPKPPGLKWPDNVKPAEPPHPLTVDQRIDKALDDYRDGYARWEQARGPYPSLPDMFGMTEGTRPEWPTWEVLNNTQREILRQVYGALQEAYDLEGRPTLEEATARSAEANAEMERIQARIEARIEEILSAYDEYERANLEEQMRILTRRGIPLLLWNLKEDFELYVWWMYLGRTGGTLGEVERGLTLGGHEPGYTQNRGAHGRWAPGDGVATVEYASPRHREFLHKEMGPLTARQVSHLAGAVKGERVEVLGTRMVVHHLDGTHTELMLTRGYTFVHYHARGDDRTLPYDAGHIQRLATAAHQHGVPALATKARVHSGDTVHLLRLGFDGTITEGMHESEYYYNHALRPPASFVHARSIADAMQHADARAWWEANANAPHLEFVTRPGSPSHVQLAAYLASQAGGGQ